jgi:cyclic pyranopterin phosphate synthase
MPEEDYEFTPHAQLMQVGEIESLARIFVAEGVNKIRLTGGEPLVRKDAAEIIRMLSKLPVQLTMTTNGTRIHEFIDVLKQA